MGSGRMASDIQAPRAERTTRSSTRSQTQKSYNDEYLKKPSKAKDAGKVEKKRTNATDEAKKAKKAAKSESKQPAKAENPNTNVNPSATHPTRTLSITSPLVNKPIICHQYTPVSQKKPPKNEPPFIFTHGAGGTLSAPAVIHFCTGFVSASKSPLLAFQGSSNLGARVKGFHACHEHMHGDARKLVFGGRSMGARAAVVAAMKIMAEVEGRESVGAELVLVSYPLKGPKDVRDRILLNLPEGAEVLFVVGDKDAMCPLQLLEEVRAKMKGKTRLVVVRGADHGMNVKPASRTKEVGEESGKVAARWLSGNIESEGETLYVGEEE